MSLPDKIKPILRGDIGTHEDQSVDRAEVIEEKAAGRASLLADDLQHDRDLAEVVAADLSDDRVTAAQIAKDLASSRDRTERFQRALFVMFLVVGLLAASSYFNARDANRSLGTAQQGLAQALRNQEAERIQDDARFLQAQGDRQRIANSADSSRARARALERLVVTLLANTDDPELRKAFQEFAEDQGIDPNMPVAPSTAPSPSR